MIKELMSLLGYKEYLVEITWLIDCEKWIIPVKAWSSETAIIKVANLVELDNQVTFRIVGSR